MSEHKCICAYCGKTGMLAPEPGFMLLQQVDGGNLVAHAHVFCDAAISLGIVPSPLSHTMRVVGACGGNKQEEDVYKRTAKGLLFIHSVRDDSHTSDDVHAILGMCKGEVTNAVSVAVSRIERKMSEMQRNNWAADDIWSPDDADV